MFINLPWSQWYLMLFIVFTAVAGDYLVSRSRLQMIRAFFDNITHAIIGALSWYTVCSQYKSKNTTSTLCEVLMCTFASSVVDVDHFLAAGSLSLSAATSLENRPIFHCSTIPIASTIVGLCISKYFNLPVFEKAVFIFFTALATHHTRDANRRGYWVFPFGSTKPLPYTLYIIITLAIPYLVCGLMKISNVQKHYKYTTSITIGQIQDELYIAAGILGAICLILLIMVIVALIWTYRLRVTVEELKDRMIARAYRNAGPQSVEDFENPRRLTRFDSQPPVKKFIPPPPMQQQQQNDWGNGANKPMNPMSNSYEQRGFPGDSRYPSRPRNLGY